MDERYMREALAEARLAAAAGETVEMPIHQPGGTILVRAAMLKGRLTVLTINGRVKLVDEGTVEV